MIATIYLDNYSIKPEKLDTFELPIKNIDFNKKINFWKKREINEKLNVSYFIDITSTDLYGKIIVYDFDKVNKIFFLYNILKKHRLLDEFNTCWKYRSRRDLKEINSGEFFVMIRELLSKAFPDHENEIIYEDFNNNNFLEKIPGTIEYIFKRQNETCKYLREKTGFDWEYSDPIINYITEDIYKKTISYCPEVYRSIDYDPDIPKEKLKNSNVNYYYGKYRIEVVNNIFKIYVFTKIFNKVNDVKDNKNLLYYISSACSTDPIFTAIAYSWDEVFEFINRINKFEHNIRKENGILNNLDAYITKENPKRQEDSFSLEIQKINENFIESNNEL